MAWHLFNYMTILQRVGVLSALFMLLMVSNAMWYGTGANSDVAFKLQLGPLRYDPSYFGSVQTYLTSPQNLFL